MNVAVISSMYPNSQVYLSGIFVHEQIKELQKLEVKITVYAPIPLSVFPLTLFSEKWKKLKSVPKYEIIENVKIIHTRYLALPHGFLKHLWAYIFVIPIYLKLRKNQGIEKIDIIHAHGSIPDDYSAKILSKLLKVPYILTVHGETVYMRKKKAHLKKSLTSINNAAAVIGVSDKVLERIKKLTGRRNNLFKVYNGFTIINHNYDKKIIKENIVNILFGAGLIERKGCEYVIRAFNKISKKHENIFLTIAGGGKLFNNLVELANSLNISSKIKFLGTVNHYEMLEKMYECDIFILPSWDEAFGVVYLEAMSLKKPIIGTYNEGISEIIIDGENGLLANPRNLDELFYKLNLLVENKSLREKIGLNGYNSIKFMTWENNAKEVLKIYNELNKK